MLNEQIKKLKQQAESCVRQDHGYAENALLPQEWVDAKFAELIVQECLKIVKSNTYGPCGEYDYSYSYKSAAADERAETIHEEIAYHFGVEK